MPRRTGDVSTPQKDTPARALEAVHDAPVAPLADADVMDVMLGRTIGSYRIVRRIGQGGMGTVYQALDLRLGRRAAVKTLRRGLVADATAAARFFNEARAISMVAHPCLVTIYEHGIHARKDGGDDDAYIVMEYIEGESLRARLDARYHGGSALELVRQLASALALTHKCGIVHRDLKPDNIMLLADDTARGGVRVKLLDFGLAKLLPIDEPGALEGDSPSQSPRSVKTRTGVLIGTPMYMSPEQCRGSTPADAKTDVYALGIILYELLYGAPPFVSDAPGELYAMHLFAPPRELTSLVPSLSPRLSALVHRMIDKKPAARPTMDQLLGELNALTETGLVDGPVTMRPSAQRGATSVAAGASDQIRQQLQRRVEKLDGTTTQQPVQDAKLGSRPARAFGRLAIAVAMVFIVVGGLFSISRLRRAKLPAAPPVVAAPLAAPVAASPIVTPAPAAPAPAQDKPAKKNGPGKRGKGGYYVRAWE